MGSLAAAQRPLRPSPARSSIPQTRSWLSSQRGFQPARLESKLKPCFADATGNSEEPKNNFSGAKRDKIQTAGNILFKFTRYKLFSLNYLQLNKISINRRAVRKMI